MSTTIDPNSRPVAGLVERTVRRHPLAVECLYTDDTKTLMSKGHHDPAEFRKACEEWNGGPMDGWGGKIRHAWGRTVPDSSGDYEFLMLPAKPHARGAYPVTTIIDDAVYDTDDDPCTRVGADGKACGLKPPCPDCGRACHDVGPGA